MKKTFKLVHLKTNKARLVEAAKHDIRKYLKRERNKSLPDGVDFWDFDCRFGNTAEEAKEVHISEITTLIDEIEKKQLDSFYIEILAKPGYRVKKSD